VTSNDAADSYPDIWIDRTGSPHRTAAGSIGPSEPSTGSHGAASNAASTQLLVEARLVKAPQVPSAASIEPYRHALLVHEYEIIKVVAGTYSDRRMLVAHWVIRDRKVLADARRAPGSTHRLTIERFDAHPELEGERVISASDTPKLPLYYETGR
jgi:hypothetical protein